MKLRLIGEHDVCLPKIHRYSSMHPHKDITTSRRNEDFHNSHPSFRKGEEEVQYVVIEFFSIKLIRRIFQQVDQ